MINSLINEIINHRKNKERERERERERRCARINDVIRWYSSVFDKLEEGHVYMFCTARHPDVISEVLALGEERGFKCILYNNGLIRVET